MRALRLGASGVYSFMAAKHADKTLKMVNVIEEERERCEGWLWEQEKGGPW